MQRPIRKVLMVAAAVAGTIWVAGLVVFITASPSIETKLPVIAPRPEGMHNLVARQFGPTIRASTNRFQWLHHPAFVVDGRQGPSRVESWMPEPDDRGPWLEIAWDRPRQVASVTVDYASAGDPPKTSHAYVLRCLPEGQPHLEVSGMQNARATHELSCPAATAIRLEARAGGGRNPAEVRLYELQVMGQ